MKTFADLLHAYEGAGSLDTLFGHSQRPGGAFEGIIPSQMTLAELDAFDSGDYGDWSRRQLGYKATPVGFAQIVGTTRRGIADELGLPDDTVFDEDTQRAMTRYLLDQTGGDPSRLRGTWEGFKNVSDDDLAAAWAAYQDSGSIGALGGGGDVGAGPTIARARAGLPLAVPLPGEEDQVEYADNWLGDMQHKRDDFRAGLGDKLGLDARQMAGIGGGLQDIGAMLMRGGYY